jgi:6-phosphogluconolactonase
MKIIFTIVILLVLGGCETKKSETIAENNVYPFFVGTYTEGESQGIYKYILQNNGTINHVGMAAISDNPSFLAMSSDKRFLLAVNEINQEGAGLVESFLITGDSLALKSRSSSGGAHPCYVSVNESGFVLTANYTGGNVGLLRLDQEGALSDILDVQQHTGRGTTDRQRSPHAHFASFGPSGNDIIAIDLGTNELWFSHLDTEQQKFLPSIHSKIKMQPGAGPRHLAFHPNRKWVYVLNELDCTAVLLQKSDNETYQMGVPISTLPVGFSEPNTCADIHISADGMFVYASNRGHNSIAIFDVNADEGSLSLVGHQGTRGDGPRNFSLSPDDQYLLVANQHTNNIVSFKRNKTTGLLKYVDEVEAPTPVCILF